MPRQEFIINYWMIDRINEILEVYEIFRFKCTHQKSDHSIMVFDNEFQYLEPRLIGLQELVAIDMNKTIF